MHFQSGSEALKMWNKWMTGFRNIGFQLHKDANYTCWLNVGFRVFSFANEYPHKILHDSWKYKCSYLELAKDPARDKVGLNQSNVIYKR